VKYLYLFLATLLLFPLNYPAAAQEKTGDTHLREADTGAICLRSTFIHGYRHGYESGYHLGNIDVNMGRQPRMRTSEFHGVPTGYSSEFGPKKSFESGFQEGLQAGYRDGFVGRKFRAVSNLRFITSDMDQNPPLADPNSTYFDQGVSAGYVRGFKQAHEVVPMEEQLSLSFGDCTQVHPARQEDVAAQASFCDGYRRGYLLGRDDGDISSPETKALAANK
jgi:hypothetical protein